MALNCVTHAALKPYLPGRILSLGHPDNFERFGQAIISKCSLTSLDLFPHRGNEIICDIGGQVPDNLGWFDVVLDCGTLEHVANIARGFVNAAGFVRIGGVIIHHLPMTWVNHGYWNICPSWFKDFYGENKFEIVRFDLCEETGGYCFESHRVVPWPGADQLSCFKLGPEAMILVVAKRTNDQPIRLPYCESKWGARKP